MRSSARIPGVQGDAHSQSPSSIFIRPRVATRRTPSSIARGSLGILQDVGSDRNHLCQLFCIRWARLGDSDPCVTEGGINQLFQGLK